MLLHRLRLTNFGPFYGEHSIDLKVGGSAPTIIIHGENMRGKTALVNAIRWCLYGKAIARTGVPKATTRLIGYDALDAGEYYMRAVLDFTHNGASFELERHIQSDMRPSRDSDLEKSVTLRRDGQFLPERDIRDTIATILHEEIARFFLFDGEMLSQYEALVSEDTNTVLLRQSIERILGLPALQSALSDVDELQSDANRRQRTAVRRAIKAERLASESDRIESDLASIDADIAELTSVQSEKQQRRDDLVERRARIASIEADVQRGEQLTTRIQEAVADLDELKEDIRRLLADAWAEPVAERADELLGSLEKDFEEVRAGGELAVQLKFRIDHLHDMLTTGKCPVCEHTTNDTQRPSYEDKVTELQGQRSQIPDRSTETESLAARIQELRKFSSTRNLVLVREKERRYRRVNLGIRKLKRELDETFERLRGHDSAEVRIIQEQYDKVIGDLRDLEHEMELQESKRTELLSERSRVRAQISKLPEANPRITTESSIYDTLTQIFTETVAQFREELRVIVQEEASDIFRQITTEPDYDGLVINEQYGLQIVDTQGRVIHDRSAGAEQVVALALIAALNRAAVREGPIVMDTPFGRLDKNHRKNILQFVPTMGSQVILLVQSGEVDASRDLVHLEGKIGRQYRLVRDGSPTKSRIERLEH